MSNACGYRHKVVAVKRYSLTRKIAAPGDYGAIGLKSQIVAATCGDGHKIAIRLRDITLSGVIPSPGDDGAIRLKANTVIMAGADGDKITIRRRDITLSVLVVSPCNDGAVPLKTQTVIEPCGYSCEVVSVGRRTHASPGNNGTILFKAKTVISAGSNGDKTAIRRRDITLAEVDKITIIIIFIKNPLTIESPGFNGSIFFKAQTVVSAGSNGSKATIRCRDITLTVVDEYVFIFNIIIIPPAVASPGSNRAILLKPKTVTTASDDGNEILIIWRCGPTRTIIPPANDRAVTF